MLGLLIQALLFNLRIFVFKTSRKSLNHLGYKIAVIRFPWKMRLDDIQRMYKMW